jgi:N-acetylneuraminic acid mutarotase
VVEVFDLKKGLWEKGVLLPTPRGYAACAAVGGKIYVAGGLGEKHEELGVLEIFDTATGRWSRGPDAPAPVAYCGSCVLAGRFFVFGGGRENKYLGEVVSFDPASGKWRAERALDFAREALAAAAVGDKAYLLGGRVSGVYLPAAEIYEALNALPGRGR